MPLTQEDIEWITKLTKPERDKGYTRTFYSYPAKFQAKLPRGLISKFTRKEDLVFDPFVGGGTTGLEAMLLERQFIGYDINPFAIFVSKVKTTYLNPKTLETHLKHISGMEILDRRYDVLDADDRYCLGSKISSEINSLVESIRVISPNSEIKHFFELALIHAIKIVGRRDFELKKNWETASLIPIFIRKANKMIKEISTLPKSPQTVPRFVLGSNHQIELENASVDLIITSPPYKDKDVEYQKLQIQRRSLQRSKRSNVISAILGTPPLPKKVLCGGSGENYWGNNLKSLSECFRVLKPNKHAFIWTGFKSSSDLRHFQDLLVTLGFTLLTTIQVQLSNDRAASSRSTHHGRKTGMMSQDTLFVTQKI